MPVSSVLGFWAVAVLLIAVPGPDWAFTTAAALRGRPFAAVIGLMVGYAGLTAAVAGGVGAVVARTPAALTALTVLGGLYLAWLGIRTLAQPAKAEPTTVPAARGTVRQGIAVSALNPKALLLFLALLPQFTTADAAWPRPAQLAVLGTVFTLTCGLFYAILGHAVGAARSRPGVTSSLRRVSGAAMLVLAAALLVDRVAG